MLCLTFLIQRFWGDLEDQGTWHIGTTAECGNFAGNSLYFKAIWSVTNDLMCLEGFDEWMVFTRKSTLMVCDAKNELGVTTNINSAIADMSDLRFRIICSN